MRVFLPTLLACLLVLTLDGGVLAKEPTGQAPGAKELSETVNRVFAKKECARVSENARDADKAPLAMTFRFRCEGAVAEVSALLDELRNVDGLAVEDVVSYPGVNPADGEPSVDVRFDVVALAGVEAGR